LVAELTIDRDFLWRDVNVGFSGWERRKIEILQLKLLKPRYVFLDEVDSWLDVDAFKSVANLLREYDSWNNCFIIVTHYFSILDYIPVDTVYLMEWWKIIWSGGLELAMKVKESGFGG
jgi:Fe-S cluster assembly ATP-binding protein